MKSSRISAILALFALFAGATVFAACSSDSSSGGSVDSELIQSGTLTVGSDIPFPPFEFGRAPDYKGFDIDIVREIAKDMGLKLKIQDTGFDTIFTDVAQGKFDMVASASTITPERQQTVNFSDPYYEAEQALLVPPDSDISTVEDLSGKIVGAQDGTTGEAYANDETDASEVRGFPNGPAAIDAVKAGQVDATIIDQPVAQDALDKGQTGFDIATLIPTGELYGFAFAKKNTALLDKVNEIVQKMKEDGRLDAVYQKYFKTKPPKGVIDGTTENPGEGS
ncbi:MAG: amino acid ABC transporter substrate-binding protein [Solirubrobacterales bacterium]|nr:amino acid ABC transporter substrate-binding protein [Solirubrobacterales bacterium]